MSEDQKPEFTPSKWGKKNKTQSDFKKEDKGEFKEITFGKPDPKNKTESPMFPNCKILENHQGEIEESIANESTATTESETTSMVDSYMKEQEWNKAKNVIKDLKRLIG